MKIRGKNLTVSQRETLLRNGISSKEIDFYLLVKQGYVDGVGGKSLGKSKGPKSMKWTLVNRNSGVERIIIID